MILLSEAVLSLLSSMLPCPKLSSPTGRNSSLQPAEITADYCMQAADISADLLQATDITADIEKTADKC